MEKNMLYLVVLLAWLDVRIELGKYRLQQEPHGLDKDGI